MVERDAAYATPEAGAAFAYGWQVVGEHPNQVAGTEVEEVASHESAGEEIAAGQSFHFGLVEAFPGGLFGADD
jgi:hypothetical protein